MNIVLILVGKLTNSSYSTFAFPVCLERIAVFLKQRAQRKNVALTLLYSSADVPLHCGHI